MIQLAPRLPMSQWEAYQEHTLGINTVPRPVAGRFGVPHRQTSSFLTVIRRLPHRHPLARPGDLFQHGAARDPPVEPGDDGETARASLKSTCFQVYRYDGDAERHDRAARVKQSAPAFQGRAGATGPHISPRASGRFLLVLVVHFLELGVNDLVVFRATGPRSRVATRRRCLG